MGAVSRPPAIGSGFDGATCVVTGVSVPCFPELTDEEVGRICTALASCPA